MCGSHIAWEKPHTNWGTQFIYLQEGKVLLQHTVDNEVSALARLTFFRQIDRQRDRQADKQVTLLMCGSHIAWEKPHTNWGTQFIIKYHKIPKISPSMYQSLQKRAPQNCNAKNPPLNRLSKYKTPGGACTWNLPSNTK